MKSKYFLIFLAIGIVFLFYYVTSSNEQLNKKLDIIIDNPDISKSIDEHNNIIQIVSGKQNNNSKIPTDVIIRQPLDSDVTIQNNKDNHGYLISSKNHKKIHLKISKDDFDESMKKGWHLDDNGTYTIININYSLHGQNYDFDVDLSTTCIGCFTGTATITGINLTNNSVLALGQTFNSSHVSSLTANFTVSGRNLSINRDGVNLSGAVLCMRMDETSGTLVRDFCGSNNGTWNGNTSLNSTTGKINNGLNFDGVNDYVNAGNGASLALGSSITVEAWIKPAVDMSIGTNQYRIANKMNYPNSGWYFQYNAGTKQFLFSTYDGAGHNAVYTITPTINVWYHVVGISNGTYSIVYVNGVAGTPGASGTLTNSNASLQISGSSAGFTWNGSIDEVRIYNRSLNATEILQNYNLRPDLFNANTNANSSIGSFNTTIGIASTIPFASTDAAISNVTFKTPETCVIGSNTIYDCGNTSLFSPTVVVGYTENSTTLSQTLSNGFFITNESILHANNGTGNISIPLDSTFISSQFKGIITNISNNNNASVSYNSTHININEGLINNSLTYWYNITIPYNNIPTSSFLPETNFYDNQNIVINTSATDNENNVLTCEAKLNNTVLSSCSQNIFNPLPAGNYIFYFNVTDKNGTLDGLWTWYNSSEVINISGTNINIILSNLTDNFYVNHSWSITGNSTPDIYNVSINNIWDNSSSLTYRNNTYSPHSWQNISVCGYNQTSKTLGICSNQNTQISNNIPIVPILHNYIIGTSQWLNFSINSTDLDGDSLVYSSNNTIGLFNTISGNFSYIGQDNDKGVYTYFFSINDGYGGIITQVVSITVQSTTDLLLNAISNSSSPIVVAAPGFEGIFVIVLFVVISLYRRIK